jgi:WD40 repeat protein
VRLQPGTGELLNRIDLGVSSMALAPDGNRIAVATGDGKIRLFDANLQPLQIVESPSQPRNMIFLRDGDLLIPTDNAVLRMDPADGTLSELLPIKSFALALDDAEDFLCVSRWFFATGYKRDPNPFGVSLFRRNSKELIRDFSVPGHQCVHGTISPDGKLLALEAHRIGVPRMLIAVFDVTTGQEIARRKSSGLYQLTFLPDSRTLAIAFSGHVTGEPITLWTW